VGLHRLSEAAEAYRTSLRLNPSNPLTLEALAAVESRMEKTQALDDVVERASEVGLDEMDLFGGNKQVKETLDDVLKATFDYGVEPFIASKYIPYRDSIASFFSSLSEATKKKVLKNGITTFRRVAKSSKQDCIKTLEKSFFNGDSFIELLDSLCFLNSERKQGNPVTDYLFNPLVIMKNPQVLSKIKGLLMHLNEIMGLATDQPKGQEGIFDIFYLVQLATGVFREVYDLWSSQVFETTEKRSAKEGARKNPFRKGGKEEDCPLCPGLEDLEAKLAFMEILRDGKLLLEQVESQENDLNAIMDKYLRLARDPHYGPTLVQPDHSQIFVRCTKRSRSFFAMALALAHYYVNDLDGSLVDNLIDDLLISTVLGEKLQSADPANVSPSSQGKGKGKAKKEVAAPPDQDKLIKERAEELIKKPLHQEFRALCNLVSVKRETAVRIVKRQPAILKLMKLILVRSLDTRGGKKPILSNANALPKDQPQDLISMCWQLLRCLASAARFLSLHQTMTQEGFNGLFYSMHACPFQDLSSMGIKARSLLSEQGCAHGSTLLVDDLEEGKKEDQELSITSPPSSSSPKDPEDALHGVLESGEEVKTLDVPLIEKTLARKKPFSKSGQRLFSTPAGDGIVFMCGVERVMGKFCFCSLLYNMTTDQIRDSLFFEFETLSELNEFWMDHYSKAIKFWTPVRKVFSSLLSSLFSLLSCLFLSSLLFPLSPSSPSPLSSKPSNPRRKTRVPQNPLRRD